jgi:hypothetical protein
MIRLICGHLAAMSTVFWAIGFFEVPPDKLRIASIALILACLFLTVLP